ncbi:hypothetical protein CDO44_03290 [Pigmentiphaga sp. NML080357]|jgi:hypothetical protein|uniref:hypothetical protein n=1 Tax=Pigmentiphaga sp. NML080357 TaxID=2008675 RepID=UPI000B4184D6|nr:hypothetical protein [Pigmentiphaga sp. NML080357]OVZ63696.1 hypothetical protein CDO44_03290 [Pigmentiphaga sp. NML080357]
MFACLSIRFLAAASAFLLAIAVTALSAGGALAASGADPAHFRLTPALLDRMEAVAAELKNVKTADVDDDDDDADAESVEDIARKLDAQPKVRAALARHGLTSLEYATATLAALHAGMYLATGQGADTKALASFTPEQRANIKTMLARRKK